MILIQTFECAFQEDMVTYHHNQTKYSQLMKRTCQFPKKTLNSTYVLVIMASTYSYCRGKMAFLKIHVTRYSCVCECKVVTAHSCHWCIQH